MLQLDDYVKQLNTVRGGHGLIVYWMSRDQRVDDNLAFGYAQRLASQRNTQVVVVFTLRRDTAARMHRYHTSFMVKGLMELEKQLQQFGVRFAVLLGEPVDMMHRFAVDNRVGAIVCDFSPLRLYRQWHTCLAKRLSVPVYEVDAHNLLPVWYVSSKQEYGAYTLRPRLARLINQYVCEVLEPVDIFRYKASTSAIDWQSLCGDIGINYSQVLKIESGTQEARRCLYNFLDEGIESYSARRNDPFAQKQSDLSPFIHFGQIGIREIVRETYAFLNKKDHLTTKVLLSQMPQADHDMPEYVFLEELVVRRELAENYCFYNDHYDSFEGFPAWAQESLLLHQSDTREHLYNYEDFEMARTHDVLWNAAQLEMVRHGKMHGYMRMYWAKKILEWTSSPQEALLTAKQLNDRYEIDGRDPNGYTGIAWAIGGVHDRPWIEREIFGKVRYMNRAGCARKFDVDGYIRYVENLEDLQGGY